MTLFRNNILVALITITFLVLLWKALKLLWLRPKRVEKCLRQQGLKGNPYKPFLGDFKELISVSKEMLSKPINFNDDPLPRVLPFIYPLIQKYGKNCFAWIGPVPWLFITDTENIREALTNYEDFHKPDHPITRILMVGLFGQEGQTWAKHRRIINPAFHMEKLKSLLPTIHESCSIMASSWEALISEEGPTEIDVWPFLESLTGDIISRAAFGSSYEQGKRIFDLQTEFADLIMKNPQPSNYIPGWRFLPTKKNKRLKAISKEVQGLLTRMIDSRKKEMEAGESTKNDLLGLLLESNMTHVKDHGNEMERRLTTKEVVDECKLFYLAGSETTSGLLVWTMVLLSRHQDWQDRARTEVLQAFGKDKVPDFEGLNRLKIVTMIIHEVLRLYSPGYMLMRKVHEDTMIRNLLIPAGTEVLLPLCMIHRDPNLWGEDAKDFNPERFAEGVAKATKGQAVYFPFSTGPRVCIGQNFTLLEAKLFLATILRRFTFELSHSYVHAPCAILTLKPQHGAHLLFRKLEH